MARLSLYTGLRTRSVSDAQEIREFRKRSYLVSWNRTARFDAAALAVYPHHRNAKLSSRNHVVKVTLSSVQQSLLAGAGYCFSEMRKTWFVGPDLLCGHYQIEVDGEVFSRGGQEIIINVGENTKLKSAR